MSQMMGRNRWVALRSPILRLLLGCGTKKALKWTDIESIVVENLSGYNKTVLWTIISGKPHPLKWAYYFGIDPEFLKDFLILQRSLFASGRNIHLSSAALGLNPKL